MVSHSSDSERRAALPVQTRAKAPELRPQYRRIFIADSRDWFANSRTQYDPGSDLVLTYDFALRREIEALGGTAFYLDQLIDPDVMQENNFRIYRFFGDWHVDASGTDIFLYDGVPFGFAFRLEFWNDYVFYARAYLCLERVAALSCDELYVGTELGLVESILGEMGMAFVPLRLDESKATPRYYFPIHRWMRANIRRSGLKARALNLFAWGLGTLLWWADRARGKRARRPSIFVQEYHPTHEIIKRLRKDGKVRVIAAAPSRARLFARYISLPMRSRRHQRLADRLLLDFRARRSATLVLSTGSDITQSAYRIIEECIAPRVAESIRTLEGAIHYLKQDPFRLELLIANIGDVVTLVDCVCRAKGIPSYLIINGMLGPAYLDDSKYASVINAYSSSIKENYFRGMENIVCLGDPRMDQYPPVTRRNFDPDRFTVTIGTSGHNNTDLNSYVAVEFDFMHDVFQALSLLKEQGVGIRVLIKVRPNGYRQQYEQFADEYFPGLVDEIIDQATMRDVLTRTDFFISIFSQTLFEASCMGIPVLYYRVGDVFKDPPFDGRSELVTVDCVADLVQALDDFRRGHPRYDAFLDRAVMERYIGPLDGGNLERNLTFVYRMAAEAGAA